MFSRLLSFFRSRRQQRRRAIFRYFDGARERRVDPLVVLRALAADKEFLLERHPALAAAGDADAQRITIHAVRMSFAVPGYSFDTRRGQETGLTDEEAMELLSRFADFLESIKKNGSPPLTSPVATVFGSSAPVSAMESGSPTNASSDSPST